jgi:hypothetical protein
MSETRRLGYPPELRPSARLRVKGQEKVGRLWSIYVGAKGGYFGLVGGDGFYM